MNTEFIAKSAKDHWGKASSAGGLSLAVYMVWAQLSGIQAEMKEMRETLHEVHTQVMVLDAIRSNNQLAARERYE